MADLTPWKPGMFYDVGGAAALYWPDQHPCGKEPPEQRWLVFEPWGGVTTIVGGLPREDFTGTEMGMAPFMADRAHREHRKAGPREKRVGP